MASTYEFWLLDDTGKRITLLQNFAFFSYSRSVDGFGTIQIGFPYLQYKQMIPTIFQPDWRIDVWRSPKTGIPMRRENMYLLRLPRIYDREDGMVMIVLYGRDCKDLLNRRIVIQPAGTTYTRKSDFIDDMMKEIVREQMLYGSATDISMVVDNTRAYPQDEFFVAADHSLGPLTTKTMAERNVMDTLRELHDASVSLNEISPNTNLRIYYDVVPVDLNAMKIYILDEEDGTPILDEEGNGILDESSPDTASEIGFAFVTYAGLYGLDRTDKLVFSRENNNVKDLSYADDHFEERNTAVVKGFGRGDSRDWAIVQNSQAVNQSRWNRIEVFVDASTEPDQTRLDDFGYPALEDHKPVEELNATFLNVPSGPDTPESLYGIQWDLGDLLPVYYAGRYRALEVKIVYVAVDDTGTETITGRNELKSNVAS